MRRFSFPKSRRLLKNKQFKDVLGRNICVSDHLLTVCIAENECGRPRLGISVGKSCGSAVVRNRLKRLLREVFRRNQHEIPAGFDYLIMFSPGFTKSGKKVKKELSFQQVRDSFLALIEENSRRKGVDR